MKTRRLVATVVAAFFSLAIGTAVFAQPFSPAGNGPAGNGPAGGGPATGKVSSITADSIVVGTQSGERTFSITSRTAFVREVPIETSAIKTNDTLLVLGPPSGEGIRARVVTIVDGSKTPRFLTQRPANAAVGGQGGGQAGGAPMAGPVFGTVIETSPLTIDSSGSKKVIEISKETAVTRQVEVAKSEIKAGSFVRIIGPAQEAMRIILTTEEALAKKGSAKAAPVRKASASAYYDSPFGFLTAPPQPGYLLDLDVNWMVTGIRLAAWEDIETRSGFYDFTTTDRALGYLYQNGVNTAIELRAINPVYGTPSGKQGVRGVSFPENHMAEWGRFVKKLVERYDGDGVDDSGKAVVKDYQLIHELLVPGSLGAMIKKDYWREHPEKYALFYKTTYDAVRSACADCKLYFIGGFDEDFLFKGEKNLRGEVMSEDGLFAQVLRTFASQNVKLANFGFDYHYWSHWLLKAEEGPDSYRTHARYIEMIKRMYAKFGYADNEVDIISREAGVGGPIENEREQAEYIIKAYATSIAAGQRHLFWTSIVEYLQEADLFLTMGLVNNPMGSDGYSHRKLGYWTYKLMVSKLKETSWPAVKAVRSGADNVYVYKFPRRNGGSVYVAWWDYFDEKGQKSKDVTLQLDLRASEATVTNAIPEGKNGIASESSVAFVSETKRTANGGVTVKLGSSPVYIEEGVVSRPSYRPASINSEILDRLLL